MTLTRLLPLAFALASAGSMIACTTAPAMPMGAGPDRAMASPERMAAMDAQMKTMREMHARMMNAKTPEERQALMPDHMKAMQGGMSMMKGMTGMGGMGDPKGMSAGMGQDQKMMMKNMAMMQMMMDMMADRMPATAAGQ